MGYKYEEIEKVEAIKLHGYKTDVQVQITVYLKKIIAAENLTIKLVSNPTGFNQIDKRWIDKYVEMWNIPEDVADILKRFTGEIKVKQKNLKDSRRMFFNEMENTEVDKVLKFFTKNKVLIISDLIKGNGKLSAGWMLVALKSKNGITWVLKSINHAMNIFSEGEVEVSKRGSLNIGQITMQRKGGDGGRDTANMLQFKTNPVLLFKK